MGYARGWLTILPEGGISTVPLSCKFKSECEQLAWHAKLHASITHECVQDTWVISTAHAHVNTHTHSRFNSRELALELASTCTRTCEYSHSNSWVLALELASTRIRTPNCEWRACRINVTLASLTLTVNCALACKVKQARKLKPWTRHTFGWHHMLWGNPDCCV